MIIAVDAMGGDHAPEEIVKGALAGAREHGTGITLVGSAGRLGEELSKCEHSDLAVEIVDTDEHLVEGEHPAYALRQKRKASILVATRLVKEGKADAVVSAGPTGGVVASALQVLGTMEGLARPVVGGLILGFSPSAIVMDCGGNVGCRTDQLLDFAIVGTVYARKLLNIGNPTVALLSTGAEEGKGNEAVREAYQLIRKSGLNFVGNLEGYDIPAGRANVIVCDGFVGNILVKFSEAIGQTASLWLTEALREKLPENDIKEIADGLIKATNVADALGGGPLWAVNGVVCIAHGRSKSHEFARIIGQAKLIVELDLVDSVRNELAAARKIPMTDRTQ
jgi:glycerol-3-phosphate acyltransferase PlsX